MTFKALIQKLLLFGLAGALTCVFGLWLFFTAAFSVGHINFALTGKALKHVADLAPSMELNPGESVHVELQNDKLVQVKLSSIKISRKKDGQFFVNFYRGGGHLGMQGYLYSHDPTISNIREVAGYSESVEFRRLREHWWTYDSLEEN